jgi:hypothetical protein
MNKNTIAHHTHSLITLKSGIVGRRERPNYPDWWKGYWWLETAEGKLVKFHESEIVKAED